MRPSVVETFLLSRFEWIVEKIRMFRLSPPKYSSRGDRREFLSYKEAARALALSRLEHFNAAYGFSWERVSIRNQKTRWGSCSKKGNLNFNYKIALLPPPLADYIIVHELCHLGEFNHSDRFWRLVGRTMPEYRAFRDELSGRNRS
jgi:predicted metal-dependent hydrolase